MVGDGLKVRHAAIVGFSLREKQGTNHHAGCGAGKHVLLLS
jgi:hypothetical protein